MDRAERPPASAGLEDPNVDAPKFDGTGGRAIASGPVDCVDDETSGSAQV